MIGITRQSSLISLDLGAARRSFRVRPSIKMPWQITRSVALALSLLVLQIRRTGRLALGRGKGKSCDLFATLKVNQAGPRGVSAFTLPLGPSFCHVNRWVGPLYFMNIGLRAARSVRKMRTYSPYSRRMYVDVTNGSWATLAMWRIGNRFLQIENLGCD